MNVFIRPAETADLPRLREIFACARAFMSAHGNPTQWGSRYPEDSTITRQMHADCLYAVESSTGVHGVFACVPGEEPTYAHIEGGSWLDPSPYVTIHSLAGDGQIPHLFSYVLDFCLKQCPHVRLDTHRNNHIVQRLAMENDFSYRGVIFVRGNSPRLAFERLPESHALPPEPTALLRAMGITAQRITRFHSVEDDAPYDVWKADTPAGIRVLKKAKAYEGELYARFLQQTTPWTPRLYDTLRLGRDTYLLLEYMPGRDLCRCTREALTSAVTSLAELQKAGGSAGIWKPPGFPMHRPFRSVQTVARSLPACKTPLWMPLIRNIFLFSIRCPVLCATMTCYPSICWYRESAAPLLTGNTEACCLTQRPLRACWPMEQKHPMVYFI